MVSALCYNSVIFASPDSVNILNGNYIAQSDEDPAEGESEEESEGESAEEEGENPESEGESAEKEGEKAETEKKDETPVIGPYERSKIKKLKSGDSQYLVKERYHRFERIITAIGDYAKYKKKKPVDYLAEKPIIRLKLIKTFIGGLRNPDPRIRLTSTLAINDILLSLRDLPAPTKDKDGNELSDEEKEKYQKRYKNIYFKTIVYVQPETRRAWYIETVEKRKGKVMKCLTKNLAGEPVSETVTTQIDKLDLYVTREYVLGKLRNGSLKPKDFKRADPRVFQSLTEKIEGDKEETAAIHQLDNKMDILISGLSNPDKKLRKKLAGIMVKAYFEADLDNLEKNKIEKARDSYPVLELAFKDYIKAEEERKKKEENAKPETITEDSVDSSEGDDASSEEDSETEGADEETDI